VKAAISEFEQIEFYGRAEMVIEAAGRYLAGFLKSGLAPTGPRAGSQKDDLQERAAARCPKRP
jgi:hypothetical protein